MAFWTVARAILGYFFLVFIVRVVGRRPGKQLTPIEFVLIFFLGGLMLTGVVGAEPSLINAICQILAIACGHWILVQLRSRSSRIARLLDGTPLLLIERQQLRAHTMRHMGISANDVMAIARDGGLSSLDEIHSATLERNGEISILPKEDDSKEDGPQEDGRS